MRPAPLLLLALAATLLLSPPSVVAQFEPEPAAGSPGYKQRLALDTRLQADRLAFEAWTKANGLTNTPFVSTLTSDNGPRWELFVNYVASFKYQNLSYPLITFVMEPEMLEACAYMGIPCFYPNNTVSGWKLLTTNETTDDWRTDYWRSMVAAGKPLSLFLSACLEQDFAFSAPPSPRCILPLAVSFF